MKEPERRTRSDQHGETPTARPAPQAEASAQGCALGGPTQALDKKIGSGQAITSAGRQGYHQLMHQTRQPKSEDRCRCRPGRPTQGTEYKPESEFVEGGIPAPAPELRK